MANLNRVLLIGRLTRSPEARTFANGGKVVQFGFAVNNRRKNSATGQWENEPVFLDCKAFNRGDHGKLADLVEQNLRKGSQAYLEGHLQLEQWNDKQTGDKRSKLSVVVDQVQFLDPRDPNRQSDRQEETPPSTGRQQSAPPPDGEDDIPF